MKFAFELSLNTRLCLKYENNLKKKSKLKLFAAPLRKKII